jgi:hypothetical protein
MFDDEEVLFGSAFLIVCAMHSGALRPAAILGLLVATSFWVAYFDVFSTRAERILGELQGAQRVALARDAYAYAHFPMIVGIVLFGFAMKKIIGDVGEELTSWWPSRCVAAARSTCSRARRSGCGSNAGHGDPRPLRGQRSCSCSCFRSRQRFPRSPRW